MTDHIHGEDSYVECDRFYVVSVNSYEDIYSNLDPEYYTKSDCYCGEQATHISRVCFTTYANPEGERELWPDCIRQTFKAHRCEDHRFQTDE